MFKGDSVNLLNMENAPLDQSKSQLATQFTVYGGKSFIDSITFSYIQ